MAKKIEIYNKNSWLNLFHLKQNPIEYPSKVALSNNPIVSIKLPHNHVYVTDNPDCMHACLVSESTKFMKSEGNQILKTLVGHGIFTMEDGPDWVQDKKRIMPFFHKESFNTILNNFLKTSIEFENYFPPLQSKCNLDLLLKKYTLQSSSQALFGMDISKDYPYFINYLDSIMFTINQQYYSFFKLPLKAPFYPKFRKKLDYINYAIQDLMHDSLHSDRTNFAYHLLNSQNQNQLNQSLYIPSIKDEVMNMLIASFKTTSIAHIMVWVLLNKHPQVLKRVIQELEQVIGKENVEVQHLYRLKYCRAVILETLRLYPPAYNLVRKIKPNINEFFNYEVEPNALIILAIRGLHRNPKYWHKPLEFIPERFLDNEKKFNHEHIFIPFGLGQRTCLGAEFAMSQILAFLAVYATKYQFNIPPNFTPVFKPTISLNISNSIPCKIQLF